MVCQRTASIMDAVAEENVGEFPDIPTNNCWWYFSNLLVDEAVVLLPGEARCHERNTIVDLVGNLLFPVLVGTIQPFEVGSTKLCCFDVVIEREVLTCCC